MNDCMDDHTYFSKQISNQISGTDETFILWNVNDWAWVIAKPSDTSTAYAYCYESDINEEMIDMGVGGYIQVIVIFHMIVMILLILVMLLVLSVKVVELIMQ